MAGRTRRRVSRITALVTTAVVLSGCATDSPFTPPGFAFLNGYAGYKDGVPVLLDNAAWWEGLQDPTLDTLVARALEDNLSLALATERITEAQASLQTIPGNAALTPGAALQRQKSANGPTETRQEASLDLSWVLDPYGSRRQQIMASRARIEVADAEQDAARLLLLSSLGNAYVDLRYYQRSLAVRQREIRSRRQTLRLTRTLFEQKAATRLDLIRAEARLTETEATIPGIHAAIEGQKYLIATLLGATPGTLDIDLGAGAGQPVPRLPVDVGIPADLLRNRPDIRIAERLYYAAVVEIGVARAELYPRLSLGGTINLASVGGVSGTEYYFGPTLTLPSIPTGSQKARVAAQESRARQAHTSWRSTVLDAVREVETALVDYSGSSASVHTARKAAQLYREAVELTRDQVMREGATIPELIAAEESVADAELALADSLRRQARGFIGLNVSLGSGNAYGKESAGPVAPAQ